MASASRILLVVCPEGRALRVFTCVAGFGGWRLGKAEVVELASDELQPELIAAAVRPLALRWSVPPEAEVALVLPAVVGGTQLLDPPPRRNGGERAWHERELAGRIPFALKDIEYETQAVGPRADRAVLATWMPRNVAFEFRAAFSRLGLVLGEIVFRAQLHAFVSGTQPGGSELVVERWAGWSSLQLLAAGRILRSLATRVRSPRELADRLRLELLSLEASGRAPSRIVLAGDRGEFEGEFAAAVSQAAQGIRVEHRPFDTVAAFVRFWRAGGRGIWLVPENPASLAIVRRLAYAIAGCGLLVAAGLAWHTAEIRDEIAALEARESRLRPQYQALLEKQKHAADAAALADTVERFSATADAPREALLAVFNALPHSAWVTRFAFEPGRVTVAGKGLDSKAATERFQAQPGVLRAVAVSSDRQGAARRPAFEVEFDWKTAAAGTEQRPETGAR